MSVDDPIPAFCASFWKERKPSNIMDGAQAAVSARHYRKYCELNDMANLHMVPLWRKGHPPAAVAGAGWWISRGAARGRRQLCAGGTVRMAPAAASSSWLAATSQGPARPGRMAGNGPPSSASPGYRSRSGMRAMRAGPARSPGLCPSAKPGGSDANRAPPPSILSLSTEAEGGLFRLRAGGEEIGAYDLDEILPALKAQLTEDVLAHAEHSIAIHARGLGARPADAARVRRAGRGQDDADIGPGAARLRLRRRRHRLPDADRPGEGVPFAASVNRAPGL